MENKFTRMREEILRISGVNPRKCMRCGKCSGACPSYDKMEYHPHQFAYMIENGELEKAVDLLKNAKSDSEKFEAYGKLLFLSAGIQNSLKINAEEALAAATDSYISDFEEKEKNGTL